MQKMLFKTQTKLIPATIELNQYYQIMDTIIILIFCNKYNYSEYYLRNKIKYCGIFCLKECNLKKLSYISCLTLKSDSHSHNRPTNRPNLGMHRNWKRKLNHILDKIHINYFISVRN